MGLAIAFNPCFSCNRREMCHMCELEMHRSGAISNQKWISVEEPPEEYRDEYGELIPFLVCCKGTVYPFRAVYDGKCWGDGIGKLNVTHWMPLPDAPKGDEGK